MTDGPWEVYVANEVVGWLDSLDHATHARVVQAIDTLADNGPGLGRPLVDTIQGSSIPISKSSAPVRSASCSSSTRGDQRSCSSPVTRRGRWRTWYTEAIPLAEQRYERYLTERAQEEGHP